MSQPISIIREQEIGYNEHGQATRSDTTYVKLSVSLLGLLARLKGARLSVFLCLALNEAEISLGHSTGLSLENIVPDSGFSERQVLRAAQFLTANNFATELEVRGSHNEKLYRASAYAWFGDHKAAPASNSGKKQAPASSRGDKMSDRASNVRGVTRSSSSSTPVQSRFELDLTTDYSEAASILSGCGILTRDLDLHGMTDRDASAIAEYVTANPDGKRSPAGWVYTLLRANPRWRPPERQMEFVALRRSDFNDAQWRRLLPVNRQKIIADETGNPDAADDPEYGCDQLVASKAG